MQKMFSVHPISRGVSDFFCYAYSSFLQWDVNYIYLIMEYCGGGDLLDFIRSRKTLTEVKVKYFLQQLGIYIIISCGLLCIIAFLLLGGLYLKKHMVSSVLHAMYESAIQQLGECGGL